MAPERSGRMTLIKEQRLLARSIFIIDADDVIRYVQIVPELTDHPEYDQALDALRDVMGLKKAA